jgi:hypothetical protein
VGYRRRRRRDQRSSIVILFLAGLFAGCAAARPPLAPSPIPPAPPVPGPPPAPVGPPDPRRPLYLAIQAGRFGFVASELTALAARTAPEDRDGRSFVAEMTARSLLERERWQDTLALTDDGLTPAGTAHVWFARGFAAARASWPGGTGPLADRARLEADSLALADRNGGHRLLDLQRFAVLIALAAAQEERPEMTVLLTHVLDLDEREPVTDPPALLIPIREIAGDLWLQVARFADARREYTAAVARYPGRARSWLGLARAAARASDAGAARDAYTRFLEIWKEADADLPELAEARTYLGTSPPP